MAKEKLDNMIKCVHKENGKIAFKPKNLFKDPEVAIKLDWRPLDGKRFEDAPVVNNALEVRESAGKKEFELAEKKRLWEEENAKTSEPALTQPELSVSDEAVDLLADKRHFTLIIKEINESSDPVYVANYLEDGRKSVKETAKKKYELLTLNK